MNKHEQSRFENKSAKLAYETIERGVSAAQEAANGAKQSLSSSLAGMRELNITLIDANSLN
jgi:hypothetical protein